jgi:hypothetical protein
LAIPPREQVLSDPVKLGVKPSENLLVSIYVPGALASVTEHWDAQQDSYLASGNHAQTESDKPFASGLLTCWMLVDRVDVLAPATVHGTVVALGDSITDGFLSDFNANRRWPDDLARRLEAGRGPTFSVTDEGIWGNEVLTGTECCGVSVLARLDRDVFEHRTCATSSSWRALTTSAAQRQRSPSAPAPRRTSRPERSPLAMRK